MTTGTPRTWLNARLRRKGRQLVLASCWLVAVAALAVLHVRHRDALRLRGLVIADTAEAYSVVAYVPEARWTEVRPGAEVRLRRASGPEFRSSIRQMGSEIVARPERLGPGVQWGVPVYVPVPEKMRVLPGESLEVAIRPAPARARPASQ